MSTYYVSTTGNDSTGTGASGAPWATPGKAGTVMVGGDILYIQNGTYTLANGTVTPATAGGPLTLPAGTSAAPTMVIGYNSTPGDLDAVTTFANFPTLQSAGAYGAPILATNAYGRLRNVILDGASAVTNLLYVTANYWQVFNCKAINFTNIGFYPGDLCRFTRCLATAGHGTPTAGFYGGSSGCTFTACRATANPCSGFENGGSGCVFIDCLSDNNTGGSSHGFANASTYGGMFLNCTAYNNGGDGFNFTGANAGDAASMRNCLSISNAGYQVRSVTTNYASAALDFDYNFFYGTNIRSQVPTGAHDVTLTANPLNSDFTLNSTAGGGAAVRGAGFPGVLPGSSMGTGSTDGGCYQSSGAGGTVPSANDVRYGTAVGSTTGLLVVPAAQYVDNTQTFDYNATPGTLTLPTNSQVLSTVTGYGAGGTALAGNVTLPSAANVLASNTFGPSSGTTGTATVPTASQVLNTVTAYGAGGTALAGNVLLPTTGYVQLNYAYGPSSGMIGAMITTGMTLGQLQTELTTRGLTAGFTAGTAGGVNLANWLGSTPSTLSSGLVPATATISGTVAANVTEWAGAAVGGMPNSGKVAVSLAAGDVAGDLPANVAQWLGTAPNALSSGLVPATATISGTVAANVTQWAGTAVATPNTAGIPEVDLKSINGTSATISGTVNANVTQWLGSAPNALSSGLVPATATISGTVNANVQSVNGTTFSGTNVPANTVQWGGASVGAMPVSSVPTVSQIAASILATPTHLLATDTSGAVTTSSVTDKAGYSLATTPPTVSQIVAGVWNESQAAHTTAGTFGNLLDTPVSTRLAMSAYTSPPSVASIDAQLAGTHGAGAWGLGGGTLYTPAQIAAAVWTDTADLATPSTPGSLIAQNLDAKVSSRSTYAGGPVASVTAPVTVGANNDKQGYTLSSAGLDAVLVESGVNARQALSPILAATAGVLLGDGTGTIVIKGGNVSTTRITATTDNVGNRTAVTLSLPA
jgi:hypothetical protein